MNKASKPLFKLSPSSLNLFVDCPRCFWLQVVQKVKRPDGAFPSLPSGMDKVLKEHFDRFMEQGTLPPELHTNGLSHYKLFDDKDLLKVWRNNLQGIKYLDVSTNILLHGAVDNILVKGKKLIILDYKTRGYPVKEDTHEHYLLQMYLYAYLLEKNGYEVEDYAYLLFYYPNRVLATGEVVFDTHLKKIAVDPQEGEKVFKDVTKVLLDEDAPKPNADCGYCVWAKGMSEDE